MKKIVRTISLVSLCVIILGLCGCGANKDNEILDRKAQAVEQEMKAFTFELEKYRGLSDAQIQEYINTIEAYRKNNQLTEEKAKMNEDLIKEWHEIEGQLGEYKEYGEFEFDSAGKTYTATLTIKYEKRDVNLIYVISKKDFEITGANAEIVYTLGEKMSKAGLNTITGIVIVFCMLVLMCIIIYAFNIINYIQAKYKKKKEETKIEITTLDGEEVVSEESEVDDKQLIAVIAAAIAASTNQSTDDFVVRSIRRKY